jgi:hypothetical protein
MSLSARQCTSPSSPKDNPMASPLPSHQHKRWGQGLQPSCFSVHPSLIQLYLYDTTVSYSKVFWANDGRHSPEAEQTFGETTHTLPYHCPWPASSGPFVSLLHVDEEVECRVKVFGTTNELCNCMLHQYFYIFLFGTFLGLCNVAQRCSAS